MATASIVKRHSASHFSSLKPAVRAYLLALLATVSPRLLSLLVGALRGKYDGGFVISRIKQLIRKQASLDAFPAATGLLVGGSVVLPSLFNGLAKNFLRDWKIRTVSTAWHDYWVKYGAAFISSWIAFRLLNSRPSLPIDYENEFSAERAPGRSARPRPRRRSSVELSSKKSMLIEDIPPLAGGTLDITIFAFVRALGVVLNSSWSRYRARQKVASTFAERVQELIAPSVFALSSSVIMFNWFHSPERLPSSYRRWISSASQIDGRLIEALRQCRFGNFVYGKDTGLGPLLRSLARDLGYPESWGDPALTIPIPCELYHSGSGPSCEWHAIVRFVKGWIFAMKMYLPLNLLILSRRDPEKRSLARAFIEASQSSAFLGGFIGSFYYAVCLARTRLGPKLFSKETVTPNMWDGGLGVGAGCAACGWSILLEKPARRQELAFFVAPRAIATICPRRYPRSHILREQLTFAASTAVILVAAQQTPEQLQGVFGRLLYQVFK